MGPSLSVPGLVDPGFRDVLRVFHLPGTTAQSQDGIRFDLVLDSQSQGGAHTSTLFGPYGVSVSPDAVINDFAGVEGFWFYLLSIHELSNVWAGYKSQGWPWADGSPLWKGSSALRLSEHDRHRDTRRNRAKRPEPDPIRKDEF